MSQKHHSYRQWMIMSSVVLGLQAGILVVARLIGLEPPFASFAISLGVTLLVLSGVIAIFRHYSIVVRQDDQQHLERATAHEYWVQWTYDEEEWREITQESWANARRGSVQVLVVFISILAGLGLV